MRFAIRVEYFGKNYSGWQRQNNAISVQQVLEEKLAVVLQQRIVLCASGRTDAGVHSVGQIAHFDAETSLSAEKIMFAANTMLPDDVKIMNAAVVADDFHAQYSAKRKTYVYRTYVSRVASPMRHDCYVQIIPPVDIDLMREAAKMLVGEHDFKAFSCKWRTVKTTVRTIYRLDIDCRGDEVLFTVEGNGFLYNMVRIIVGTLVYIGRGKLPISVIPEMLETGVRKVGGKTFPAKGLTLQEVIYTDGEKPIDLFNDKKQADYEQID